MAGEASDALHAVSGGTGAALHAVSGIGSAVAGKLVGKKSKDRPRGRSESPRPSTRASRSCSMHSRACHIREGGPSGGEEQVVLDAQPRLPSACNQRVISV